MAARSQVEIVSATLEYTAGFRVNWEMTLCDNQHNDLRRRKRLCHRFRHLPIGRLFFLKVLASEFCSVIPVSWSACASVTSNCLYFFLRNFRSGSAC